MTRASLALIVAAAVVGSWVALVAQRRDAFVDSRNHPAIAYGTAPVSTPVTALNERLASGAAALAFDSATGYLQSVLRALDVPIESQVLVYSPTSFQAGKIHQQNPRAIYFNDTVSVAWVRGGDLLEITTQDPRQGTIFYSIGQVPSDRPQLGRQEHCVSCHLTWDTLGVPGLTVKTTFPRKSAGDFLDGGPVDHRRPMHERWGGWFVTGTRVPARHKGNVPLIQPAVLDGPAPALARVDGHFDTAGYLRRTSDIVALLVLEHQAHAANMMTWLDWEARLGDASRVRDAAEALADYLLFVGEAPIEEPVEGNSGFAEVFAARGPRDARGRSLRDLKLDGRLMRYPLSYMIYTPMFDAITASARVQAVERISAVLTGRETSAKYAHLGAEDRQAILEILRDTKPDLASALR